MTNIYYLKYKIHLELFSYFKTSKKNPFVCFGFHFTNEYLSNNQYLLQTYGASDNHSCGHRANRQRASLLPYDVHIQVKKNPKGGVHLVSILK